MPDHDEDELNRELYHSVYLERQMLLARLKRYQESLDKILTLALISQARPRKNESLQEIARLAEQALTL